MRRYAIAVSCLLACGFAIGCSDDDCPTCPSTATEQPLAELTESGFAVDAPGIYSSVRVSLVYTTTWDTLFSVVVDNADSKTTLSFTSSDPHFADFVAMLTNGVDDNLSAAAYLHPGGGGFGRSASESFFLRGGLRRDLSPDLAGVHITKVLLHIDGLGIISGGGKTTFELGYRVVFMGTR